MSTAKIKTKGPWWEFAPYLRAREAFTTHGALHAEERPPNYTGYLPAEYVESVQQANYVVYSYSTPIAWYRPDLGSWTMPDVKYSPTTSRHQSTVRTALPRYEDGRS